MKELYLLSNKYYNSKKNYKPDGEQKNFPFQAIFSITAAKNPSVP